MNRLRWLAGLVWLLSGIASAPTAQTSSQTFDVASVKRHKSGDSSQSFMMRPGGRLTAINVPLRILIRSAYSVDDDSQLLGGPAWIGSDRFDIIAKPEGTPASAQIRLMLRGLLADRFKLTVHNETRQLPVYALVLSRRDGRLGPQLRPAAADCSGSRGRSTVPPIAVAPTERPTCGTRMSAGKLVAGGVPISQLAGLLAGQVSRIVQDRTGLTGNFDLDLRWTLDQVNNQSALTDDSPSIFTAVQEQLGLKLESTQGAVDVLVIDHVEHPTED